MNNDQLNMELLNKKKEEYAAITAEFAQKKVSLDDWLWKYNRKDTLRREIYELETPIEKKIADLEAEIMHDEQDIWRDQEELNSYRGHFSPERDENVGQGGALLGPASAAPPPQVLLEEQIEDKTLMLQDKKRKLAKLLGR